MHIQTFAGEDYNANSAAEAATKKAAMLLNSLSKDEVVSVQVNTTCITAPDCGIWYSYVITVVYE